MQIALALPSKGRLKEKTLALLEKAVYAIILPADPCNYRAHVANVSGIDILFLSASEIARELGHGNVDLGITGEDLIRETLTRREERIEIRQRLGFSHANVVVAVEIWHDVATMADLDDVAADFPPRQGRRLRIVTKYRRLTQQFFSQKHGIHVYRIVESLGRQKELPLQVRLI